MTTLQERLQAEGRKRILALDGGGLRGFLTLGILKEIEAHLKQRHQGRADFRLCDYFDLIAGTSTGAIIAAALSLGMTVKDVEDHYRRLGEMIFKRSILRPLGAVRAKYPAERVKDALISVFGQRCMDSPDFRTGLLVVTKRQDTGSIWPLTNNPAARYFYGGTQPTTIPTRNYLLWQVVRASTAAPHFFDPEVISIGVASAGVNAVKGDFVDGGVSPHNNPALQALLTATLPGYGLQWKTGPDNLLVVSVGTGKANVEVGRAGPVQRTAAIHAVRSLMGLMEDCSDLVEIMMQWLSDSPTARKIDREIGTAQGGPALCHYLRYNVHLRAEWCRDQLGLEFSPEELQALEPMDDLDQIDRLYELGSKAGEKLIKEDHFPNAFNLP
jgi:predicted acylesterase/phospholipase RssA